MLQATDTAQKTKSANTVSKKIEVNSDSLNNIEVNANSIKNEKAFKKRMKENWLNNIEPSYKNAK